MSAQPFQDAITHLIGQDRAFREHHLTISFDQLDIAACGGDTGIAIIGQFISTQDAPALKGFHPAARHYQGGVLVVLHFIGGEGDWRVLGGGGRRGGSRHGGTCG